MKIKKEIMTYWTLSRVLCSALCFSCDFYQLFALGFPGSPGCELLKIVYCLARRSTSFVMSSAANLYSSVISDVINSVRESFLDESVDEQVCVVHIMITYVQ